MALFMSVFSSLKDSTSEGLDLLYFRFRCFERLCLFYYVRVFRFFVIPRLEWFAMVFFTDAFPQLFRTMNSKSGSIRGYKNLALTSTQMSKFFLTLNYTFSLYGLYLNHQPS